MMMINGVLLDHDNLSNLTCASNEDAISISSGGNRNEVGTMYPVPQISVAHPNQPPPPKKKRNLPGNPDPEAEVVALSPKSLTATNRFLCEICKKGFQRDQNLQLHRRGHNLPWKLKQRANKDQVMKKKVYVCPEPTCVHHHPSRALGDLTGIKKHFYRKHGEKKWKCEKCSKRYAVQSDWKAHSKICGTREYRCDCGTLFSRRDSFITHRAFCDALAEESARATITPPSPLLSTTPNPHFNLHPFQLKRELQDHQFPQTSQFTLPPWLSPQTGPNPPIHDLSTQLFSPNTNTNPSHSPNPNPNPNPTTIDNNPFHEATFSVSPHMSATALLQKAAQMGVTMSKPHQAHESGTVTSGTGLLFSTLSTSLKAAPTAGSGLVLPTREGRLGNPFGGKAGVTSGCMEQVGPTTGSPSFEMASLPSFEEAFGGMLNNQKMGGNFQGNVFFKPTHLGRGVEGRSSGNDGLTRDFLGLRAFSHGGFPTMAELDHINSSSSYDHQSQAPWEGNISTTEEEMMGANELSFGC